MHFSFVFFLKCHDVLGHCHYYKWIFGLIISSCAYIKVCGVLCLHDGIYHDSHTSTHDKLVMVLHFLCTGPNFTNFLVLAMVKYGFHLG